MRRVLQGDQGPESRRTRPRRRRTGGRDIKNGTYPLSRPLFFYVRAKPSAEIKAFTDWVLSAEGQGIVTKVGYFPSNSPDSHQMTQLVPAMFRRRHEFEAAGSPIASTLVA